MEKIRIKQGPPVYYCGEMKLTGVRFGAVTRVEAFDMKDFYSLFLHKQFVVFQVWPGVG